MQKLIADKLPELEQLCKEHYVKQISLFGSAAHGAFSDQSDIDLLVRFSDNLDLLEYADNYFDFLDNLKQLFKREVDLVSEKALKNEILISEINNTKIELYAA
jgi:predicted nucleotidyltransferase